MKRAAAAFACLGLACGTEGDGLPVADAQSSPRDGGPVMFRDVTAAAGLAFVHVTGGTGVKYLPETMGAGGAVLDYDGDGRMDLYFVQSGEVPGTGASDSGAANALYRNAGAGRFEDVTARSGTGDTSYGMGAAAADVDGDGRTDLYVVNFGANVLLRNGGDGRFLNATEPAGVGDERWGSGAAFLDADRDGDLDLYVVNYLEFSVASHKPCGIQAEGVVAFCHPDAYPMAPDVYYRNRGDGTFELATTAAGLSDRTGKGLGVTAADFDGDGWPDLYVANDSTPNFLYRNQGDGRFVEQGLLVGVAYNDDGKTEAGMGVAVGDVDGDGQLDVFVTNLSHEANALYVNEGGFFDYRSRVARLHAPSVPFVGFGAAFADLDADGDLDLVVANGHIIDNIEAFNDGLTWRQPSQVFQNEGELRFAELDAARAGDLSIPRVARGLMRLDHDDDGRVDVLVTYNGDRARLYENAWPDTGHWIGFLLEGPGAVGARLTLEVNGERRLQETTAGSSYQVSHDPRVHFGLGEADHIERLEVRWSEGDPEATSEYASLEAGRYYRLARGSTPRGM